MIKFLQSGNKAAKYILAGFLLILAASMVTYLIPGFMSSDTTTTSGVVASVGGHEVHSDDVMKAVQLQLRQQGIGQNLPPQYLAYFTQQAAQQLIQQAEISYEGERMGLSVSDKELQDELHNDPYKTTFFPQGKWI